MTTTSTSTSLTLAAYDKIKQAIMRNQFKPGYCLSGNRLAKTMGMSRTPIREAIQLLARDGLIEIQTGVGFFVKQLTVTQLRDITEVRKVLECTALRAAMANIPVQHIMQYIDKWTQLLQCPVKNDLLLEQVRALDTETHRLFTDSCKNSFLLEILESIAQRSTRIQYMSIDMYNVDGAIQQHIEILEAMKDSNIDQAVQLLGQHINFSVAYILDHPYILDAGDGYALTETSIEHIFAANKPL